MLFLSVLAASLLLPSIQHASGFRVKTVTPKSFADRSPDVPSSHVVEMTRRSGSTQSSKMLHAIRKSQTNYGATPITNALEGQEFTVSIQFGSQTFNAIMDTGSSDTWVATSNFQCVNIDTSESIAQTDCAFGSPLYYFDATTSEIPDENFNTTYADGEFLTGCMINETITLANITVPRQEVAAVNLAGWEGDSFSSGLVGLAYPGITSAFAGTNPHADNFTAPLIYDPLFTTMWKRKLVAPLFSIALNRGDAQGPSGYLALGGTPPVEFNATLASTPIEFLAVEGNPDLPTVFAYYVITPDKIVYSSNSTTNMTTVQRHRPLMRPAGPPAATSFQAIVDSGTTLIYFPTEIATAVNALFNPPAIYNEFEGAYIVDCTATAPNVGVQIGGTVFDINPLDMILDDGTGSGVCITGINDAGFSGFPILGDVFLKSVVAIFDVGASEMRFGAREFY